MKRQQGFTLIELMIVVAIIGILAAVAVPAYQNYTIRAQVSEGTSLVGGVETAFAEAYANTSSAYSINSYIGISNSVYGTYVSSVGLTAPGQIAVVYGGSAVNAAINGSEIYFQAYTSPNGDITWLCNAGTASTNTLKNKQLKAVGATAVATTPVAMSGGKPVITNGAYLPAICR